MTAPLAEIAEAAADLPAPAITLVGAVASLREQLAWFERRPLFGPRVVVTRARAQASGLAARLSELGAQVVEAPGDHRSSRSRSEPPDLASYDIVCLTSANGVGRLLAGDVRALHGVTVAAVGRATAEALARAWHRRRRGAAAGRVGRAARRRWATSAAGGCWWRRRRAPARCCPTSCARGGRRSTCCTSTGRCASRSMREAVVASDLVTFTSSSTVDERAGSAGAGRPRRASGRSRSGRSRAGRCERTASSRWSRPIRTTWTAWSRRCCGRRR